MTSPSPSPSPATSPFSLRIVSLDHYMSPPIPDLDFSFSDFHRRDVHQVPVIRIFGSTPAGQKACLHIHRALPYLYIPCPEDLLHSPQEGHEYLHALCNAIEKALTVRKGTASSKVQHVHGCNLVRAKKFYGYHSSEELFIKIYLYYPHEVVRVANLLLAGDILNRSFQPYESHLSYLLQFMVDYNLHGMSHIHTSKFKFRPPLPNGIIPVASSYKKLDMAYSSSGTAGNPPFWFSSSIPNALVWSHGHGNLDDEKSQFIRRQSICALELDSSIDDIQNEKYKLYTSLSQTGSDVKMVQSLIPIWEEEYERSGIHSEVKYPNVSKPLPEDVLKSFEQGIERENMLAVLCLEAQSTSSSDVSSVEIEDKLDMYIKSYADIGNQRLIGSLDKSPKCSAEQCENVPTDLPLQSETIKTEEPKNLDIEALGLLSWLASSQAVEDLNTEGELAHEAILSPLVRSNSYKKAMEQAHLDYESASQQECQDILDSVEVPKPDELEELGSVAGSHGNMLSVSSGNRIQQLDGSSDDMFETPQDDFSKGNLNSGKEKFPIHHVGKSTSKRFHGKTKKKRMLWGSLPLSKTEEEHDSFEKPASFNSSADVERKLFSEYNSSSGSEDRYSGLSKADRKVGTVRTMEGKNSDCPVRDLMRRKRYEQPESKRYLASVTEKEQKLEIIVHPEEEIHPSPKRGRTDITSGEPSLMISFVGQDGVDQDSMIDSKIFTPEKCPGPTSQSLQYEVTPDDDLHSCRESSDNEHVATPTRSKNVKDPSLDEQVKSHETGSVFSRRNNEILYVDSHSNTKSGNCELFYCKDDVTTGCQLVASCACAKENMDNNDECLKSHSCENETVSECDNTASNVRNAAFTELVHMHDGHSKLMHDQNGGITQSRLCEADITVDFESNTASGESRHLTQNLASGELDGKSLLLAPCSTYLPKENSSLDEMTFSRKPPSIDDLVVAQNSRGTSRLAGYTGLCDEALALNYSSVHLNGHHKNDVLPFFDNSFGGEKSFSMALNVEDLSFHQESALGVPTHFLNDGSVLYLLTHAISPPSLNCVQQWVSEVQPHCLMDTMGCCENLLESSIAPDVSRDQPPTQDYNRSQEVLNQPSHVDIASSELEGAGPLLKENIVANSYQDISQISGPDVKSVLTPLSQIGFRDPASVSVGQQLTLISIEILAESRGDLLPDPQFDPIKMISLAVQEDTTLATEVYVLMCGNEGKCCKSNIDGISDCNFVVLLEERELVDYFVKIIVSFDPDVLMGWEIQGSSLGFLAERAAYLGINLLNKISRTPKNENNCKVTDPGPSVSDSASVLNEPPVTDTFVDADAIISDEWGRSHASGIHVGGRIVLNVWRLMRAEIKLNMYSLEAVSEEVLRRKVPLIPCRVLDNWFSSGPERARYRCIKYMNEKAKLNLQILNQLDMINRTSELARVFGIDFFSVLSRGSQFRVESMLLRLAHTQNYLAISPGNQQVATQPAMECLPLVMEPESGFYADPVVVLDFQSLYPSMIIAYNLCYSTCLGKVVPSKASVLGVSTYSPDPKVLKDLGERILLTPNGVMYVPSKVRQGVLPRLLEEILSTRIMVKQAMKKLIPSEQVLQRIFNARQLALKLISNVTYGYTAAGFSGRMPCAELADSIVQCGRMTLETAISFVNEHDKWKAKVIYGDTDSMFVLLKGRTSEEAFRIGNEIASSVTAMNPNPVTLKMEKVYQPCFLLTKKRYVGYSYESPAQINPIFDAKGIETVRRDTCPVVAKTLEKSLRLMFEHHDISKVKSYLQRQWTRILSGKFSVQDFLFAKEVRLGTYRAGTSSLPPAAIVAMKAMRADPRAKPHYGERVPYVVIHGEPGARLMDLVVDPHDLLDFNSTYRLNDLYYINKQIIPALQRVFGLLGADLYQWFLEMPRPFRPIMSKRHSSVSYSGSLHEYSRTAHAKRNRIDTYYTSKSCTLCGQLVQDSAYLCTNCSNKQSLVAAAIVGRTSRLEREIQHLTAICRHCGGGDWIMQSGVKCTSLACSVFYERRKVQKELQALANFATDAGFYPTCMAEWF